MTHPSVTPANYEPHGYQFHRLFRGIPNYRWWKPLVFGILSIVFGFTLQVGVSIIMMAPMLATGDLQGVFDLETRILALDTQDPFAISMAFLSLAVWIPAIMFAAWAIGIKPVGRIWSVAFRIRWRYLGITFVWAVLAFFVTQAVAMGLDFAVAAGAVVEAPELPADFEWRLAVATMLIALVLVPFQAAAEELMFRGAMMQVLGAWIKNPLIPILLPSLLFALAHVYDVWGMVAVGLMGITCAWLTWRTGGLEAAIALHTVNNLGVFAILSSGITGTTRQETETGTGVLSIVIQVIMLAVFSWLAVRTFERKHRRRPITTLTAEHAR